MAKLPYFPFYVLDWLSSRKIMLMTDAQKGIYITLLAHQWADTSCSIPTDKALLKKMLPGSRWKNIEYVMNECFIVQGFDKDRARNERLIVEHSRCVALSSKRKYAVKCREDKRKHLSRDEQLMNKRSSIQIQNQIQIHKKKNLKHIGEKTHKPRFVPPSLEEIKTYCIERKNAVDPEAFLNYYDSIGWLVGKKAMRDWRAAIRTWEKNNARLQGTGGRGTGRNFAEERGRERTERLKRVCGLADPVAGNVHGKNAERGRDAFVDSAADEVSPVEAPAHE